MTVELAGDLVRAPPKADRAAGRGGGGLVPVERAGDLVRAQPKADRAAVRTGGGEPAVQPALYERLRLRVGELVAELYGRVAGDGGENVVLAAAARAGSLC